MSTDTKLGNEFLRVPKLDVSGKNWVIGTDETPVDPDALAEWDKRQAIVKQQIASRDV